VRKLHRIYCGTHAQNTGMQKLALKLGMRQEGCRREAILKAGRFADIIEYGILSREYVRITDDEN
jgi:RimJ/RimL family protein N-acetyltransferase